MYKIPTELYQHHKREFKLYLDLLLKWNSKINLTSFTRTEEIEEFHFLDSLAFTYFFTEKTFRNVSRETFLDIGAGNGLPSLALKIIYPQIKITLVESIQKKCSFIKTVIRELQLKDVIVLNETITSKPIGSFDFVISRAFSSLKNFAEVGAPQLKPFGILATLKGERYEEEISEAVTIQNIHDFQTENYLLPHKEMRKIIWTSYKI